MTIALYKRHKIDSEGKILFFEKFKETRLKDSVCRFKSQSYLAPSSGISIVWRADSWAAAERRASAICPSNDGDAAR